jgi:hypothetical protein
MIQAAEGVLKQTADSEGLTITKMSCFSPLAFIDTKVIPTSESKLTKITLPSA